MRIDVYLQLKGYFDSRNKASEAIKRGEIRLDGKVILKPSFELDENSSYNLEYTYFDKFVSVGGYKLKKALEDFNLNLHNLTVCDIGASTGGFTDCALQNGAQKVYAVDLNDTLLHHSLKSNCKVKTIVKNAKDLTLKDFNDEIDVICADLSFISATQVMHVFYNISKNNGIVILLIKPQFEMKKHIKLKNGIIKDQKLRVKACKEVYDSAKQVGFRVKAITTAPITDNKNVEFLMLLEKNCLKSESFENLFIN